MILKKLILSKKNLNFIQFYLKRNTKRGLKPLFFVLSQALNSDIP